MTWQIEYLPAAQEDLRKLDRSQQLQVLKAIEKVAKNPLAQSEGGYGKPLANHMGLRLAGYYKIKLLKAGLRIVYTLIKKQKGMKIIVISLREDELVYKLAKKRIKHHYT